MVANGNECLDSDNSGTFHGDWHYNEARCRWEGNPVLSVDVSDTVASIRHKINAEGSRHTHSAAMKKEYMDRMLTWSESECSLDFAFRYLRFAMAGLGSPPERTLDKSTKLSLSQRLEHLTFCAVGFTLWTRSVSFLTHQ